jgi:CDP-diglyceride synthetase
LTKGRFDLLKYKKNEKGTTVQIAFVIVAAVAAVALLSAGKLANSKIFNWAGWALMFWGVLKFLPNERLLTLPLGFAIMFTCLVVIITADLVAYAVRRFRRGS